MSRCVVVVERRHDVVSVKLKVYGEVKYDFPLNENTTVEFNMDALRIKEASISYQEFTD